jgi:aconitase A
MNCRRGDVILVLFPDSNLRTSNSYGARRGNHEVMVRGTLANIRLRNNSRPARRVA